MTKVLLCGLKNIKELFGCCVLFVSICIIAGCRDQTLRGECFFGDCINGVGGKMFEIENGDSTFRRMYVGDFKDSKMDGVGSFYLFFLDKEDGGFLKIKLEGEFTNGDLKGLGIRTSYVEGLIEEDLSESIDSIGKDKNTYSIMFISNPASIGERFNHNDFSFSNETHVKSKLEFDATKYVVDSKINHRRNELNAILELGIVKLPKKLRDELKVANEDPAVMQHLVEFKRYLDSKEGQREIGYSKTVYETGLNGDVNFIVINSGGKSFVYTYRDGKYTLSLSSKMFD